MTRRIIRTQARNRPQDAEPFELFLPPLIQSSQFDQDGAAARNRFIDV